MTNNKFLTTLNYYYSDHREEDSIRILENDSQSKIPQIISLITNNGKSHHIVDDDEDEEAGISGNPLDNNNEIRSTRKGVFRQVKTKNKPNLIVNNSHVVGINRCDKIFIHIK